ncbi:MAG: hypothetical protein SGILL_004880 [Bacillariaceae sp.]
MASGELARLAEDGSPGQLADLYSPMPGVNDAFVFNTGAPYFGGETLEITVEVSRDYPLVTIASMAINTNDAFVALNGCRVYNGLVLDEPALDAGSEENDELCANIPGPACAMDDGTNPNGNSGENEEGFVHVHRGFHGVGDLTEARYDWRNPMMRVEVSRA